MWGKLMKIRSFVQGHFWFVLLLVILGAATANGQTESAAAKSDSTKADSAAVIAPNPEIKEVVLGTIRIEAVLEMPSVTIIPKRATTDVGDVPLEIRSFDKELKTKPQVLSTYGEDLETGKKIKKIDKNLK